MKKIIGVALVLAVVFGAANASFAGDREWATAGKILTGVVGLSILADAASRPCYQSYDYAPCPPRPVYQETTYYYPRPYYRPRPVSCSYEEVRTYRHHPRYERRVSRYYY